MTKQQQVVEHAPERLSIENARELLERLQSLAGESSDCCLDLGAVASIDSAALQMLLVARKELAASGTELRWQNVSPVVAEEAGLLGLDGPLALD